MILVKKKKFCHKGVKDGHTEFNKIYIKNFRSRSIRLLDNPVKPYIKSRKMGRKYLGSYAQVEVLSLGPDMRQVN